MMKMLIVALAFLAFSSQLLAIEAGSQVNARVAWVHDGNTMTVTTGHVRTRDLKRWRVRLVDMDAPEKQQPFGKEAHDAIRDLVLTREIIIQVHEVDATGRLIGRVFVQRSGEVIDVNHEMVRLGMAWVNINQLHDESLKSVEKTAQDERKGLWGEPGTPVAPWDWRKNQ